MKCKDYCVKSAHLNPITFAAVVLGVSDAAPQHLTLENLSGNIVQTRLRVQDGDAPFEIDAKFVNEFPVKGGKRMYVNTTCWRR